MSETEVRRFAELFRGFERAYGQYTVTKVEEGKNKHVGPAKTVTGSLTTSQWRGHLDGTGPGIGIIMLQQNNTCRFGVIDVDNYQIDHVKLCKRLKAKKLPLVVCRSKSGGAHMYVFMHEDVPAAMLRDRLAEWTALLGLSSKTEQFPKQISRATPEETGNWINIPYQNAHRTVRYAFDAEGEPLTELDAFLDYAEKRRVGREELGKTVYVDPKEVDLFYQAPPCLVALHSAGGFAEGSRNNGMTAVAVYLKKRYPDDWRDRMATYNMEMANLTASELVTIAGSVTKKEYNYSCKQAPINDFCNRRQCLAREFGVGDNGASSITAEIMNVIRYDHPAPDPPMWSFELNGRRVMVDNDTFYSKDLLNKACLSQANCVPLHIPPAKWLLYLNTLVQSADVLEMPSEAGPAGQMWEQINNFMNDGVNGLNAAEVFLGKVYKDNGRAYFRAEDLFSFFKRRQLRIKSEQEVYQLLRQHGVDRHKWTINGARGNVWSLPLLDGITPNDTGPYQEILAVPEVVRPEKKLEHF